MRQLMIDIIYPASDAIFYVDREALEECSRIGPFCGRRR